MMPIQTHLTFDAPKESTATVTAKRKAERMNAKAPSPLVDSNGNAVPDSESPHAIQVVTQFTILIDSREQAPYGFQGLQSDSDRHARPLAVVTQSECLGTGWGDYSIRGMHPALINRSRTDWGLAVGIGELCPVVSIERKSMDDAHSTFLGWGQHRDNFERELSQLNGLTFACVMVECTEGELIANAPEWGQKTAKENAKSLSRSIDSWRMRFNRVQWVFANDRRMAEVKTFRLLEKFWKENHAK